MKMMATRIITTLALLLVTAKLAANAACIPFPNCTHDQECQAYNDAKAATRPVYLNVTAILSEFTNTPDEFNQKLGTDYEIDGTPDEEGCIGRQACYKLSNQEVGCREKIKVEGACSWDYQCDYDKNRLPLYIWRVSCSSKSQTIYYPVPVLKCKDACNLHSIWQLVMEKVPVVCKCKKIFGSCDVSSLIDWFCALLHYIM